jgi:hypothetical protein
MATRKAWYWLAAGVLALGINSEYQSGKLQFIHRYVNHSVQVADDYARCAGRYLAQAHLLLSLSHGEAAVSAGQRMEVSDADFLNHDQLRLAVAQAQVAREELERQRPEIETALRQTQCQRTRMAMAQRFAMDEETGDAVVCPRSQHLRVAVPPVRIPPVNVAVPRIHVVVPAVHVEVPRMNVSVPPVNVDVPELRVQVPEINVAPTENDQDPI